MKKNWRVIATMSSNFVNGSAIYLHTHSDGSVWVGRKSDVPEPFDGDYDRLLDFKFVRVLGSQANVPLINELEKIPDFSGLQLASPAFLNGAADSPVNTIYRMRQYTMPAVIGGWHQATVVDFATYQMAAGTREVMDHPIWPSLSFINNLDATKVQRIMTWLLDPRWFAVASRPEQLTRIYNFLGFSADGQRDFYAGKNNVRVTRAGTVYEAWTRETPESSALKDPRNFLYAADSKHGEAIAARLFLGFLIWNWRQLLANATPQRPELFIPTELLGTKVGNAFMSHLESQNSWQDSKS